MAEQCAANGISIKYGKKVIGRLERVGPAREELTVALESADLSRLAHAVEEAKGLRRSETHNAVVLLVGLIAAAWAWGSETGNLPLPYMLAS